MTVGQAIIIGACLVVAYVAILDATGVIDMPNPGDVIDDIGDSIRNGIDNLVKAANSAKTKVKELTRALAIAAAIEETTRTGTYVIHFENGRTYIGKEGLSRMAVSSAFWSVIGNTRPISVEFIPASSDREAFKMEYMLMVEYGYARGPGNHNLYNRIWSPGRKYYYEDNGTYYGEDTGY